MNRPRKFELEALDPSDRSGLKRRTVWVGQETIDFLTRGILDARFYRLQCVREVVETPEIVVNGWNRDGFENGLCYLGRPPDRPSDGVELPPKPGMCFLVFVLSNGRIEEWRWEKFSLDNEGDFRRVFGDDWSTAWPLDGTN